MQEVGDFHEPERCHDEHDRWLAMQSAYAEYRRASEALEYTSQLAGDLPASEGLRLSMLEVQQRVAFERYLEARMEFLEFRFDERSWPGTGLATLPNATRSIRGSIPGWRLLIVCLLQSLILLGTTAFSLIREQKHVRDLEAARNQLRETLNQTRDGLQPHRQKLDTLTPPQHSAIPQVEHTPPALTRRRPAATLQEARREPSAEVQWRNQPTLQVQPKKVGAKGEPVRGTRSQRSGARQSSGAPTYFSLSLTPSRQFKRVGPIKVSLRFVDAQRKSVSLSILSNPIQINVPRLQPNRPVWINVGDHEQSLELVIDRIAGNRLDGHLVERRNNKAMLGASRLRFTRPL